MQKTTRILIKNATFSAQNQKTPHFIRVFDAKVRQTLILNTFAGKNTIKRMVFHILGPVKILGGSHGLAMYRSQI